RFFERHGLLAPLRRQVRSSLKRFRGNTFDVARQFSMHSVVMEDLIEQLRLKNLVSDVLHIQSGEVPVSANGISRIFKGDRHRQTKALIEFIEGYAKGAREI